VFQHVHHQPFVFCCEFKIAEVVFAISSCIVSRPTKRFNSEMRSCSSLFTLYLILFKDARSMVEKFALPMGEQLRIELMLAANLGSTLGPTQQIKHHLCFELGNKSSSLCHKELLLGDNIHSGFHFARCLIPGWRYNP
jgi:hypothetical protein